MASSQMVPTMLLRVTEVSVYSRAASRAGSTDTVPKRARSWVARLFTMRRAITVRTTAPTRMPTTSAAGPHSCHAASMGSTVASAPAPGRTTASVRPRAE